MTRPLNNQLLIQLDGHPEVPRVPERGRVLVLSSRAPEATSFAWVLECGPDVSQATPGQRVLCNADAIMEVNGDFLVPEDQILAIVE